MNAAWRTPWTPLLLGLLAIVWTWPALPVLLGLTEGMVGRHFDLPGTLWFLDAASRWEGLTAPLTGWPAGGDYSRADSFTLLVLAKLLASVPAHRLHAGLQLLGVWSSAWAAEAFARALGARAPWSMLSGIGFAFSGLAAAALLEGHVYHLVNPWLPGVAWATCRATSPGARVGHGVAAAVCWCLCLATTAYLGIAATLLVVGLGAGNLYRRPVPWAPCLAATAIALPVGLLYVAFFLQGSSAPVPFQEAGLSRAAFLVDGSAHLRHLAGPSASLDLSGHSRGATLSATVLALCLVAPRLLRSSAHWRVLLGTGVAALVLGLGPGLVLVNQSIIGLPLALVALVPGSELLRFPVRLLWVWFLCGSTVAALTLSAMVQNLGSARRGLLHGSLLMACLLVDVFAVVRLPLRQQVQSVTTPSAYLSGEGPVLDLYPEVLGTRVDWSQWFQGLACLYQVGHGRAIADHCVVTHPESNPRTRLTRQVTADLLSERTQQVSGQLRDLGYTAIAWHPDLFQPGDRVRLARSLDVLDSEPVRSTDGAEHVVVYRLENG